MNLYFSFLLISFFIIVVLLQNKTTTVYENLDTQLTELNKEVLRNPDYSAAKKIVITRQIRDVQDSVQITYNVCFPLILLLILSFCVALNWIKFVIFIIALSEFI